MRRTVAFIFALTAVVAAFAGTARSAVATTTVADDTALVRPLLAAINGFRAQHGLKPLRSSVPLARAAEGHAVSMAREGYFSHTSSDGTVFWKRIARSYPQGSYPRWSVGENLLWSQGSPTADQALQMWIASPEHRAIMLTAVYREVGIAAVAASSAPGVYNGLDVTVVAADFGARTGR
jgi:uncharacterized protein YkwD